MIVTILRIVIRVFFRRVEIAGRQHIPVDGPAIFVLNHPNGLVDPAFLLAFAPLQVHLLGKSTLLAMPVLGFLARKLGMIPVYRQQDAGADVQKNKETFRICRELLDQGAAIGIFPEGVSHNEPSLRPLKTGAARIALGAVSSGMKKKLVIVPAGLYYTAKENFRSSALLIYGPPIEVDPVQLDDALEPSREDTHALSAKIESALRDVTLNADHNQALELVAQAESIFQEAPQSEQSLRQELQLRKRFIEGYNYLRTNNPEKLEEISSRIFQYSQKVEHAGLDHEDFSVIREATPGRALKSLAIFALLLPVAIVGTVIHYAAYRLSGYIGRKLSHNEDDVVATIKVLAAATFFPATWIICAVAGWMLVSWWVGVLALVMLPMIGYGTIVFFERLDLLAGAAKAVFFLNRRSYFAKRLLAERKQIREEIIELATGIRDAGVPQ